MKFRFVTNLRSQTVASFENSGYTPKAWLLSTHRLTNQTEGYALAFREDGQDLYADNGTKQMIRFILSRFKDPLADLKAEIKQLRRSLPNKRRIPYPREVPKALRKKASDAAHEVLDAVDALRDAEPLETVLGEQLRMKPTHLIAKEDFGAVCLMALGLEREITGWDVSYFTRRNRITIEYWKKVVADPRCKKIKVYATLSALDYNTARAAARLAAKAGVDRVAVGYVGINKDASFCQSFQIGRRRLLSGNAPRRYVRGTEVALGIRDGFRDAGKRLRAFHALGLGAAAQIPILASSFDWYTNISMDAASPMYDSVNDRVFYDANNRGDRLSVEEIASSIVGGADWPVQSPFTQYLKSRLGHEPDQARTWWQGAGQPKIVRKHLHPDAPLGKTIPVFATAKGGLTSVQTRGRTGHNHWVIDGLAASVPSSQRAEWGAKELDALAVNRTRTVRWGVMAAREILRAREFEE